MSRFKVVVLGLVAATMLMSVAASSASAAVEFKLEKVLCGTGSFVAACWSEVEKGTELLELVGEEEFSATLTAAGSTLTGTLGGEKVKVACTGGSNTVGGAKKGIIVQPKPLEEDAKIKEAQFEFTGCSQTEGNKNCKVATPIILNKTSATPENLESKLNEEWLRFKPEETSGIFAEIKFEGTSCPETIAGKQPVKGEQWCQWLTILEDLKEHEFHCEPTESKLTLGKNEATFEALFTVSLVHEPIWDIEEMA
jgi:hypothetical protein